MTAGGLIFLCPKMYRNLSNTKRKMYKSCIKFERLLAVKFLISMVYFYQVISMYKEYNPNPSGSKTIDCAVRALCAVLEKPWKTVYAALSVWGMKMHTWGNVGPVWGAYLRSQGYEREVIPNTCPDCYTVADFAADHPEGRYVLGTGTHAVAVINGDIWDSWDSSAEIPIFYYAKKEGVTDGVQ